MEKGELFVIKQEISNTDTQPRELECLLKLYSRELSSTIDRYKNGENAFIYSEQQQQRNRDIALKALRLHGF
jgi:hypothetical protein